MSSITSQPQEEDHEYPPIQSRRRNAQDTPTQGQTLSTWTDPQDSRRTEGRLRQTQEVKTKTNRNQQSIKVGPSDRDQRIRKF